MTAIYSFDSAEPMKTLITFIGLLLIVEGLPYLAAPEALQKWMRQVASMDPEQLRLLGYIAVAAGLLLCVVAQKSGLFG
jgi:uncharacterized protein YjeT (DUF2065 family)